MRSALHCIEDGGWICIDCDRIAPQRFDLRRVAANLLVPQQGPAMKIDRVVGVLEGVPGQQENNRLASADLSLGTQLLQAGESHGGSRLTAQTLGAKFRLRDRNLGFGDIEAPAVRVLDDAHRLAPRSRIADTNSRSPRVRLHRFQFPAMVRGKTTYERIGAFGLD